MSYRKHLMPSDMSPSVVYEATAVDSDTISRRAAIDGKISIQRSNGAEVYYDEAVPVEYLKRLPSAQPEPHWIPVTERLPEASGLYLVSVKNDHERRYSKTAWFEKDVWFARQDVIAWMPLPEPYKEATE